MLIGYNFLIAGWHVNCRLTILQDKICFLFGSTIVIFFADNSLDTQFIVIDYLFINAFKLKRLLEKLSDRKLEEFLIRDFMNFNQLGSKYVVILLASYKMFL